MNRLQQAWKLRKAIRDEFKEWNITYDLSLPEDPKLREQFESQKQQLASEALERITEKHINILDDVVGKYLPMVDQVLIKHGLLTKPSEKLTGNYFFITLRPSDDHKHRFTEFKHTVLTKYITRSCFISYRYAWEQKGETPDEMGKGYHIHILALCPNWLKKTQLLKDSKSTFNKFFNGEVHESFIQIDYVRTLDHYNNIHAYMSGYKSDDWKDPACAMDIPWREKMNLLDSYGELSSKSEA